MYKARKRNRVLRIPDEKIEEYKQMGYTITDNQGKTIFEPVDDKKKIADLEKERVKLQQRVVELEELLRRKGILEDEPDEVKKGRRKAEKIATNDEAGG